MHKENLKNDCLHKAVVVGVSALRELHGFSHYEKFISVNDCDQSLSLVLQSVLWGYHNSSDIKVIKDGHLFTVPGSPSTVATFAGCLGELQLGRTVALNHIERCWSSLSNLFSEIALSFGAFPHANVYWSPRHSSGAGRHSDPHDVICIQLYGTKQWHLWENNNEFSIELKKGDILLVKAGIEHSPVSTSESSLHLTVGLGANLSKNRMQEVLHNYRNSCDVDITEGSWHALPGLIESLNPEPNDKDVYITDGAVVEKYTNGDISLNTPGSEVCSISADEITNVLMFEPAAGGKIKLNSDCDLNKATIVMAKLAASNALQIK